ncbi:7TM chemoreceptor [Cooperia oncophora]
MSAYKWYLFANQVVSALFDFVYTAVTLPVIFFPVPMGYPAGIFAQWFSISCHASIIMVVIICSWLSATTLNLFNYRRSLVTPAYRYLSCFGDHGHIYASIAIVAINFIPCTIGVLDILPNQEDARRWVEEEYTCGKSVFFLPLVQIFTPWKVKQIAITAVSLACFAFIVALCCILLTFYYVRRNKSLSRKTRMMQMRFMIYLCIQVSIPAITLFVPIIALMYLLGTTNHAARSKDS